MSVEIHILCCQNSGINQRELAAMLVDTGPSVTIVSETVAKGCALSQSELLLYRQQQVTLFQSLVKVTLNLELTRKFLTYTAFVSRNFPYDYILGLDILKDCTCFIDVANNSLYINGESVLFCSDVSPFSESVQDVCGYESLNGIEISENVTSDEKNTSSFHISNALDDLECMQFNEVLGKFRHIFAFSDNELGGSKPIHTRPYTIPHIPHPAKITAKPDRIYVFEWDHTTILEHLEHGSHLEQRIFAGTK